MYVEKESNSSNNTNKLSPQELAHATLKNLHVQIIQINLVLKNGRTIESTETYVQIIQINLVLKNVFQN